MRGVGVGVGRSKRLGEGVRLRVREGWVGDVADGQGCFVPGLRPLLGIAPHCIIMTQVAS